MKNLWCLTLTFCSFLFANAQEQPFFNSLLAQGKAEFKKDFETQDYQAAINYLNDAIALDSNHAEAHYFLAYAYSRLNSKDGKSMIDMRLSSTQKCSEALEKVIQLTPEYTGELVVLDPYSKLTAEWGSQAMSYWHNNKKDSAIWAFNEGKRRGGFGEYFLSISRSILNDCDTNAILISSGDNFTIPLWYLQIVEEIRTDVSVVDISLLNTLWYPHFLATDSLVQFDLPLSTLDSLEYAPWEDSLILIDDFEWMVNPTFNNAYLLRGDLIFLSLLKANAFERALYFTTAFPEQSKLSLSPYLQNHILSDALVPQHNKTDEYYPFLFSNGINYFQKAVVVTEHLNPNSTDEKRFLDYIRLQGLRLTENSIEENQIPNAYAFMLILNEYANPSEYPYQEEQIEAFHQHLKTQLK